MKTTSWRPWIVTAICVVCTGAVILGLYRRDDLLLKMERLLMDWRIRHGRLTAPNPNLVFVGVTKGSYADVPLELDPEAQRSATLRAMRQNWPWPRYVWADLIDRLAGAGAKTIVLDIVFAAPGEGDEQLARALEQHRDRVVIASLFSEFGKPSAAGVEDVLTLPSRSVLVTDVLKPPALDDRIGYANQWGIPDGVNRRAKFRRSESDFLSSQTGRPVTLEHDFYYESLAARALEKFGRADAVPAGEEPRFFRYTAPPGDVFRPHPLDELFRPSTWEKNYRSGEFFRDKLVVVGPAANIFHDEHATPFEVAMLGPELHLNVINAALHGEFLRDPPVAVTYAITVASGILALVLCFTARQPVRRLLLLAGIGAIFFLASGWLFDRVSVVLLVFSPLAVLLSCGVATLGYDFVLERRARRKLRDTMSYYFSPRVLHEVLANPGAMEPRHAQVTALLTDLRNSTPLAERLGPNGMFQLLNRVFEVQTAAIMGEEGNLEHFLGDQFLSYWGAPQAQPDAADRALRAALKLIEGMENLKPAFDPEVKRLFGYGVALHSGPVLVGNKGSAQRLDYGLVGDTINEAARVESLTKHYGVTLLVTREAFNQLSQPPPHRLIDRVIVKGKSVPVELLEPRNPRSAADFPALVRDYEAAFKEYAAGNFTVAQAVFQRLAEEHQDGASRQMAERCAELAAQPPPGWAGVWRMESK